MYLYLCVISMEMVVKASSVLCEFILLKNEGRQYSLNFHNVLLHFI